MSTSFSIKLSITLSVLHPIEPVEPVIETFLILLSSPLIILYKEKTQEIKIS